jgi:hypothetical protein
MRIVGLQAFKSTVELLAAGPELAGHDKDRGCTFEIFPEAHATRLCFTTFASIPGPYSSDF